MATLTQPPLAPRPGVNREDFPEPVVPSALPVPVPSRPVSHASINRDDLPEPVLGSGVNRDILPEPVVIPSIHHEALPEPVRNESYPATVYANAIDDPLNPFATSTLNRALQNVIDDAPPPYQLIDPVGSTPSASATSLSAPLPSPGFGRHSSYSSNGSSYTRSSMSIPRRPVPNSALSAGSIAGSSSSPLPTPPADSAEGTITAFLVPFPKPRDASLVSTSIPERFLLYTLPQTRLGPFTTPKEEKAARKAYKSNLKSAIRNGSRARTATGAFLTRLPGLNSSSSSSQTCDASSNPLEAGAASPPFSRILLAYPVGVESDPKQIRSAFMNAILEDQSSLSKALSRRLTHDCICGHHEHEKLELEVMATPGLDALGTYMLKKCWELDKRLFGHPGIMTPSEKQMLDAMGWKPKLSEGMTTKDGGEAKWEVEELEEDIKVTMKRAAGEWYSVCKQMVKEIKT